MLLFTFESAVLCCVCVCVCFFVVVVVCMFTRPTISLVSRVSLIDIYIFPFCSTSTVSRLYPTLPLIQLNPYVVRIYI